MEKLAFKTIETEDGMNLFLDKFQNYVGVRLPLVYARNSKIVGVFLKDKLVGGYMLVTKPGFRSLMFVPDSIKTSHNFFKHDAYEMMEVNGLWISPALKDPRQQMKVWFKLVRDIFACRKNYVLLLRDARNKIMERLLGMANPVALYEGAPFVTAGSTTHEKIQVSYTTRWSIILNSHKYWLELKNRQKRAEEFAKQRNLPGGLQPAQVEFV